MKPVRFLGDSLKCLREFPNNARQDVGAAATFRVVYTARLVGAVYVLHAFQKKTQATSKRDIDTAKARFAQLMRDEK